jgi:ribosomal-protein-alanine N-acetyltransferase
VAQSADIRTARLLITPFGKRHLTERYIGWLNDPHLMRYSEQRHRKHTLESCGAYLLSFEGTPNYFWAIEEVAAGLGHIGNINAYVDVHNSVADVGTLIGEKQAANQHFGVEAWRGICRFLFEKIGIRKITAGTLAQNKAMTHLALRAGMTEDSRRRRHYFCDGRESDVVYFAAFANDWKVRSNGISD